MIKHIFISGSVFDRGYRWQFWCLAHTDCGECAERGVCSVMAVCQTYSNPPIHYNRVLVQHEQDKLFMCQLPGNVWVKILNTLETLQWHWNCGLFLNIYCFTESKHSISKWFWWMEPWSPPSTNNSFSRSSLENFQVQYIWMCFSFSNANVFFVLIKKTKTLLMSNSLNGKTY